MSACSRNLHLSQKLTNCSRIITETCSCETSTDAPAINRSAFSSTFKNSSGTIISCFAWVSDIVSYSELLAAGSFRIQTFLTPESTRRQVCASEVYEEQQPRHKYTIICNDTAIYRTINIHRNYSIAHFSLYWYSGTCIHISQAIRWCM